MHRFVSFLTGTALALVLATGCSDDDKGTDPPQEKEHGDAGHAFNIPVYYTAGSRTT